MGRVISMQDQKAQRDAANNHWELRCYRALVDCGMVPELAAERSEELRRRYQSSKRAPEAVASAQLRREGWILDAEIEGEEP